MTRIGVACAAVFGAGLVLGTLGPVSQRPPLSAPKGEHVLAADFHVHAFFGDGALAPWDLLWEAHRNGLDVIAITNHNQLFAARLTRWISQRLGGPIALVGQEVTAPDFHMIAAGISSTIDWRLSAADAVKAIHEQGGRAIAAHPRAHYWAGLEGALASLDGAEISHPLVYAEPEGRDELRQFHARLRASGGPAAAIGSSDFHVSSALGLCRTYVFARERSEAGVLEALGAGRTVVVDDRGEIHGDAERARFVRQELASPVGAGTLRRTRLETASAVIAWLGLVGLIVFQRDRISGED